MLRCSAEGELQQEREVVLSWSQGLAEASSAGVGVLPAQVLDPSDPSGLTQTGNSI